VQLAKLAGADWVVAVDPLQNRRELALQLGADVVLDPTHINRLQLISVRAESLPGRDAPVWDLQRLVDLALRWLAEGRIKTEGIISPIVPFEDAAEAYRAIDERPAESIKLGIRFE
jgi:threonine dehydrogenase-like Zn-dependent dehydrogenase